MITNNNTSRAAHAASATEAGLTTLDPGAGYVTTMNTYTVAPERAEEVLDYLVRSAVETVRYVPGFVSMNFHLSLDRTQIVNYGQWKSREAMAAAREKPKIVALMSETAKTRIAPSRSHTNCGNLWRRPMSDGGTRSIAASEKPQRENSMKKENSTMTENQYNNRTKHLLTLMKKGDDAFNARDFAAVDAVHHPEMIAHITGNAQPIYGRVAHAAAMQQMLRIFPDVHVHNDPYPIQFGTGDWITVVSRVTGTFTGEMVLPNGKVIAPTGKAFDVELGQTTKWDGDLLVEISAFWDAAQQARQIGLGQ